jgi:hypothetical protein
MQSSFPVQVARRTTQWIVCQMPSFHVLTFVVIKPPLENNPKNILIRSIPFHPHINFQTCSKDCSCLVKDSKPPASGEGEQKAPISIWYHLAPYLQLCNEGKPLGFQPLLDSSKAHNHLAIYQYSKN